MIQDSSGTIVSSMKNVLEFRILWPKVGNMLYDRDYKNKFQIYIKFINHVRCGYCLSITEQKTCSYSVTKYVI